MYLHLDTNTVICTREIVAILDIENSSVSKITREFFAAAQSRGEIIYLSGTELPKSFLPGGKYCRGPALTFPVPYRKRERTAGTAFLKFRVCHSAPVLCRQCRSGTGTGCFVYYVRSGTDAGPGDHQRRIICGKQTYQRTV